MKIVMSLTIQPAFVQMEMIVLNSGLVSIRLISAGVCQ